MIDQPQSYSRAYIRYALLLLLVVNTFNFIDRQIIGILAEPIKRDLKLADWQLGVVTGLAFALFYTACGIPLARYAERGNRTTIVALSVGVWSLFTAMCGMATSFAQLILLRIGVGVGEAGCTPSAHSLISDYTSPRQRAAAMATYSMGTPLGSVLGLALGGFVAGYMGWRMAFVLVGLPGLILALLAFLSLREPRQSMSSRHLKANSMSWRDAFVELRSQPPFWLLALGVAATGMVGYGGGFFLPSFFFRAHGAELERIASGFGMTMFAFFGLTLGLVAGVCGLVGTWLGGRIADYFGEKSRSACAWVPAAAAIIAYPAYALSMLAPGVIAAILWMGLAQLAITMWPGPVYAGIHGIVSPQNRATASAVTLFLINIVGLGIGPPLVGVMSDFYASGLGFGDAEGLRWAQISITASGFASMLLFVLAARKLAADPKPSPPMCV